MSFQSITLKNYRSYTAASFEFGSGVSIIIGPNASGKTNLLEAVHIVCSGSSFRVSDKDLVKNNSEWARIDAVVNGEERVLKLQNGFPRVKKTFEINGTAKTRLAYENIIPNVLFDPDDIRIIGGSPERRRDYLDNLLSTISPYYKKALSSYKRALKQRNNLLKSGGSASHVFPWNIVLSRHAENLVNERIKVINNINERITSIYQKLSSQNESIDIRYTLHISSGTYSAHYLKKLEHNFEIDRLKGFTSYGPHRDDFTIEINGRSASTHASRGEARTITLALKIIEMLLIEDVRGQPPLLLLDDVFSELDGTRRRTLTEFLKDHQCIITTTDADVVGKSFNKLVELISIQPTLE